MFRSISGLNPLDASRFSPSCDGQKYLVNARCLTFARHCQMSPVGHPNPQQLRNTELKKRKVTELCRNITVGMKNLHNVKSFSP